MIPLGAPLVLAVLSLGGYDLPAPPETLVGVPAAPPQGTAVSADHLYAADLGLSRARFSTKTKVGKFRGTFRRYEALAWVHPHLDSLSAVEATLDMRSVDMDSGFIPQFMIHKFLKTDEYPTGIVRSLAVHARPSGSAAIELVVTVRGETYREIAAITVERRGEDLRLAGSFHGKSPAGNSGVLDFDLLMRKAPAPMRSIIGTDWLPILRWFTNRRG